MDFSILVRFGSLFHLKYSVSVYNFTTKVNKIDAVIIVIIVIMTMLTAASDGPTNKM